MPPRAKPENEEIDTSDSSISGPSIEIENLIKTFENGEIVAVDDVDINIQAGEFVVLVGPSGCGKTTTLRCIAGLEEPDSGKITINGDDVTYQKPKDRNLAFVFQSIALFPHMSVRKNMSFGLDMTSEMPDSKKNEKVRETAEMLGIEDLLNRNPSELSGGQQQRVSLGRAMVMSPAAFLLDEPFSALDANLRDEMRVETKQLQRQLGTAMIFVTHDQEEAMTLGDKIVVMANGEIRQVGTPYEIYNDPNHLFVAEFIGSPSVNLFDCNIEDLDGGLRLKSDFFTLILSKDPFTDEFSRRSQNVRLGIRPEDIKINTDNPLFKADISVIEPQGSQDVIHLSKDDVEFTVTAPQQTISQNRNNIPVSFDQDDIFLFSGDGERVL